MRRSLAAAALLIFFAALSSKAHAQQGIEIFGGYSYVRAPLNMQGPLLCPGPVCPIVLLSSNSNLSGFEAAAGYRFTQWASVSADISGNYGSATLTSTHYGSAASKAHLYTYLVGPQISLPGRFSPFVQAMVGVARESQTVTAPDIAVTQTPVNSFAAAFGGGIDFRLTSHIGIRAIQFREVLTRFNSGTQYQPEISVGLILHF